MDKLNFIYLNDGQTVAEFDSDSEKYKAFVKISIAELQKIKDLKGHIYGSTLAPSNKENFEDDMKILISCDIAIRTLKSLIGEPIEESAN